MKLKYIAIFVFGAALVSFTGPTALLVLLNKKAGSQTIAGKSSDNLLARREAQRSSSDGTKADANYLRQTKAAIIREIKQRDSSKPFEVSKIVFTSEKSESVAGQKQVHLSFTYQLQYWNAEPQKLSGSILLVSDETGSLFESQVKI